MLFRCMFDNLATPQITTPEQLHALNDAAAKSNHIVLWPSHLVTKDNKIIGYGSVCAMPVAHIWMDRKHATASDSVFASKQLDKEMARLGHKFFVTLCHENSPFYPVMDRFGYTKLHPMTLFLKQLP